MKVCSRCGQKKPLSAFYKQAGGAQGRREPVRTVTEPHSEPRGLEIRSFRSAGGRSSMRWRDEGLTL
jgi:hypothetical protein